MIPAPEALQRLREGSARFASDVSRGRGAADRSRRSDLIENQRPLAAVLGCSDSRVPPEIVFDQGLGDLFVVRVAGNIAGPAQVGSVEFAALQLRTRLVVVLGHSRCGAVRSTLEHLEGSADEPTADLRSILEFVRPSVAPLLAAEAAQDREALLQQAVRANVEASVNRLRESEALGRLIDEGDLVVVGAMYSLEAGTVEFFDGGDDG